MLRRFRARWNLSLPSRVSRYNVGIAVFYFSLGISIAAILGVHQSNWLASQVIQNPDGRFYPESLLLMINLVGFVFIIVVFLLQNTTQAFSANLSQEILRDFHLILILLCFVGFVVFNITAIYWPVSQFYIFVSYVFSILSLGILLSLTLIVSYYLDVSNILKAHNNRIIASINSDKLFTYREMENEAERKRLRKEAEFYTNTTLESIENREYKTADTCIQNLEELGSTYLKEVNSPVQKGFIQDLNDQFHIMIDVLGDDYAHQKNLERLTESIGKLSRETYRSTQNDDQTFLWLKSLQEIFELTADKLDRTEAYGYSISEINRTVILHLSNTNTRNVANYNTLSEPLDQIAQFPLDNANHSLVIQKCLSSCKWQFITAVNYHATERFVHSDRDVEAIINRMYNTMALSHDSDNVMDSLIVAAYFRINSLYSHIRYYGLHGLNQHEAALFGQTANPPKEANIQKSSDFEFNNPQYEQSTIELFDLLVQFQTQITKEFSDNYTEAYISGFSELMFIIHEDLLEMVDQTDEVRKLGIASTAGLCESLEEHIQENNGDRPSLASDDSLADMLILIYYYNRDDDVILSHHISKFLELYTDLRAQYGRDEVKWLYRYLKWFGAIIHNSPRLKSTRNLLNQILVSDFYEPGQRHIRTKTQTASGMGYPTSRNGKLPSLSTNQIWQSTIQDVMTTHEIKKCKQYHYYLKREKKWD